MNYGYEDTADWSYEEKEQLAGILSELCSHYPDSYDMHPYIEVDIAYPGVRIRRITHLTEEQRDELVHKADEIYIERRDARDKQAAPDGDRRLRASREVDD